MVVTAPVVAGVLVEVVLDMLLVVEVEQVYWDKEVMARAVLVVMAILPIQVQVVVVEVMVVQEQPLNYQLLLVVPVEDMEEVVEVQLINLVMHKVVPAQAVL
jgi:hypothetical protein